MLMNCSNCRTSREVRLRVDNPKNVKFNKMSVKADSSIKIEPVCTECGATVQINDFSLNMMIDRKDVLAEKKGEFKVQCHACGSNQPAKLDKQTNPRCMRCGTIVNITLFMTNALKDMKKFMNDVELAKWNLK